MRKTSTGAALPLLLGSMIWLWLLPAGAQDPPGRQSAAQTGSQAATPISPDRPGFANGSDTVAPGRIQIEMGLAQTKASAAQGGGLTTDYPEAEARVGLTPALEAEIFLPDYITTPGGDKGFGDALIGAKDRFYQNKTGSQVRASVTPLLSLPVNGAFSSGHVDPLLICGIEAAPGSRWDVQGNLDLSDPSQAGGGRVFTVTPAAAVTYQLTQALSVFGDSYDVVPRKGPSAPTVDGGLTYLLTNDVQLDAEVGYGLAGAAPTRFVGAGVSFRF